MKRWIPLLILLFSFSVYGAEPDDSVTQVRALINEPTASFWSDTELESWLDQAVSDIAARGLCIQTSDTIPLVTATYEYTATTGAVSVSDIVKVWGAFYVNTDDEYIGLQRIKTNQISELPHMKAGPPKYFYHIAGKIGILPLPTSSENAKLVRIYFSKQPSAATLALRIAELPDQYHDLMYFFAASMAYKKEHRFTESDKFYTMYLQKLTSLRSDLYDVAPEIPPK